MAESEQQREKKASDLAYEKGAEDARTDARFDRLEEHAKTVNGSLGKIAERIGSVDDRLISIERKQAERDAIAIAFQQQTQSQVTTRQFYLGLAGFAVTFGGLLLATVPH